MNVLKSLPAAALVVCLAAPLPGQTPAPAAQPGATVKATVDEVVLDFIARDKKGKPITDLKPEDITILDNGQKQQIKSFRLVQGKDAIVVKEGSDAKLDPLQQIRLVTLAFESMGEADQRKTARTAAIDLVKGEQGTNVFYAVVFINTRLIALQDFTTNKESVISAIERATSGSTAAKLIPESERIKDQLSRVVTGAPVDNTTVAAAINTANQPMGAGADNTRIVLARVMLDMLRTDQAVATEGTRLSIGALGQLVHALGPLPGRKSVMYFTWGMYVGPELDVMYRNVISNANRSNVTFYSVDTRGVMTWSQNSGAAGELAGAAQASATTVTRTSGGVTKDEIMASDRAETAGRSNVQLPIRELAESTGGFLIGDSNDLRGPLRQVRDEINAYYEVSYNPGITNYDGSFRKLKVDVDRKDTVVHARAGYFALPPEARASGISPFEMALLKVISDGKVSNDIPFTAGPIVLKPKSDAVDVVVLAEVPLAGLQPKDEAGKPTKLVHFSIGALIKDAKGEVVQKVTRDRSLNVTPDQLKMANFSERMPIAVPPGKYTLETAVLDREGNKNGMQRTEFTIPEHAKGVAISTLTGVRNYTPNAKNLAADEAFQFQGGAISPTLNNKIQRTADATLRLFFTVYQDPSISGKPTIEIEFKQNGNVLQKVPLPLPEPDAQGRIPYVMSIPAAAIPPGTYELNAVVKQGNTTAHSATTVTIEG